MNKHTFEPLDAHEPLKGATKEFHWRYLDRMYPLTIFSEQLSGDYEKLCALIEPCLARKDGLSETQEASRLALGAAYMEFRDYMNTRLHDLHTFKPGFTKPGYQFVFSRAHEFAEAAPRPELGRALLAHVPARERAEVSEALDAFTRSFNEFHKQTADFCRGASADANKFGYRGR